MNYKQPLAIILILLFSITSWHCGNQEVDNGSSSEIVRKRPAIYDKQTGITFEADSVITILKSDGAKIRIDVELALDEEARNTGLMFRNNIPEFGGMFFVFPYEEPRSFWMKNTRIPLDILYISTELEIVSIAENAVPYSLKSLPSEGPAKYVLELNGGFCQKHNVKKGDKIKY